MKKLIVVLALFVAACSSNDAPNPRPATIIVTITGECVCNVFLYTSEGLCLQSKIYDCQETSRLSFNVFYEGSLTVKAEYRDKTTSQAIQTKFNKSQEISLIF